MRIKMIVATVIATIAQELRELGSLRLMIKDGIGGAMRREVEDEAEIWFCWRRAERVGRRGDIGRCRRLENASIGRILTSLHGRDGDDINLRSDDTTVVQLKRFD
jgi:hypothetical protein